MVTFVVQKSDISVKYVRLFLSVLMITRCTSMLTEKLKYLSFLQHAVFMITITNIVVTVFSFSLLYLHCTYTAILVRENFCGNQISIKQSFFTKI